MSGRRKKVPYYRSHTVSNLPLKPDVETPNLNSKRIRSCETSYPNSKKSFSNPSSRPKIHSSKSLERSLRHSFNKNDPKATTVELLTSKVCPKRSLPEFVSCHHQSTDNIIIPAKWISTASSSANGKNRPKSLTRKISLHDFQQSTLIMSHKSSCSLSSNLLCKMKEKIVSTVYQTQGMPHLAAIVQERRQKAAEEYETKIINTLNKYQNLNIKENNNHNKNNSMSTSTEVKNPKKLSSKLVKKLSSLDLNRNKEKAKAGFRRRSISEDSYPLPSLNSGISNVNSSSNDFQAIFKDTNKQKLFKNTNFQSLSKRNSFQQTTSQKNLEKKNSESLKHSSKQNQHTDAYSPSSESEGGLSRIVECPVRNSDQNGTELAKVEYDKDAKTWSVYGADLDPEVLGNAIQLHLEKLIKKGMKENSLVEEEFPTAANDGKVCIEKAPAEMKEARKSTFCMAS